MIFEKHNLDINFTHTVTLYILDKVEYSIN